MTNQGDESWEREAARSPRPTSRGVDNGARRVEAHESRAERQVPSLIEVEMRG